MPLSISTVKKAEKTHTREATLKNPILEKYRIAPH